MTPNRHLSTAERRLAIRTRSGALPNDGTPKLSRLSTVGTPRKSKFREPSFPVFDTPLQAAIKRATSAR
jgi:hypothetical protein